KELVLGSRQVVAGMELSRDLVAKDGLLLLTRGTVLDEKMIEEIQFFERGGEKLMIYLVAKKPI
ncbi:MAG: two-component system response regulator, partial [Gallionellaceae bacterium]|nr:two-component system response regulator [Gallionellaceae bacterium]